LVAYAHAGVEPAYMGIGPEPATRLVLRRAGLSVQDLDVIEANEAFAAQACAVARELDFDPAKLNPNGSGISLGHPVGATGAIITTKAIHELHRIGGRYALVTMCIGGGQGIAAIFERVWQVDVLCDGQSIRVGLTTTGIAELCFDRRCESINKLDAATIEELRRASDAIQRNPNVRGVLVRSAKAACIVGADIFEFVQRFALPEAELASGFAEQNAVFTAFEGLPR
jgi:hypothetical protein